MQRDRGRQNGDTLQMRELTRCILEEAIWHCYVWGEGAGTLPPCLANWVWHQ